MKNLKFTLAALAALSAACSGDLDELPVPTPKSVAEETDTFTVPVDEAVDNMFDVMDMLYGPATRASARAVVSVETLTAGDIDGKVATRAESTASPVVHVVNFANDQGYAILGANRFAEDIYCITESGSLSSDALMKAIDDFEAGNLSSTYPSSDGGFVSYIPPILPPVIRCVPQIIGYDPETGILDAYWPCGEPGTLPLPDHADEFQGIPLNVDGTPMYPKETHTPGPWGPVISNVGPLVRTKWHQGSPFNDNCPERGGKPAWAGCVAVAVAQALAANQKPANPASVADGITSTWAELKAYHPVTNHYDRLEADLARLVRAVGKGVGTVYGSDGSSAVPSTAAIYLDLNVGYSGVVWKDHNRKNIREMIADRNMPVIISGAREGLKGHTWLIDGIAEQIRKITIERINLVQGSKPGYYKTVRIESSYYDDPREFMHCNFGWGGTSDGYYNWGTMEFDTSEEPIEWDGIDTDHSIRGYNYDRNLSIIDYKK